MSPTEASATTRVTTLGHSCVLVRTTSLEGATRSLLLDPGNLTPRLADSVRPDFVLVTHVHPDHIDPSQLAAVARRRPLEVYGPTGLEEVLRGVDGVHVTELEDGEHTIAGVPIVVDSAPHEVIYSAVPRPVNLTYLIADAVFAPGDAFAIPAFAPEILLAPTGAPWMKLSETIDYIQRVAPRHAIPVHDGGLAPAHRTLHTVLMAKFAPEGTQVHVLDVGDSLEV
jgi:L-ascorbate metabolism protein UlaG (beta-lactamase superfamily)